MANPFFIQSESVAPQLQQLGGLIGQYGQQQRQQQVQEEAQQQRQILAGQAQELFRSGTPDQIAEFSIANPQMGQLLSQQIGHKNEATKQNMLESTRGIITNPENTEQILMDRAQFVQDQGGDPSDTLSEIQAYRQDPEGYIGHVEKAYAMQDPEGFKAYKSATAEPEKKPFQMGTGAMAGYNFNPNTGAYSIDPEIKKQLTAKASEKAAKGIKLGAKDRQSINKDVTGLIKDTVAVSKAADSLKSLKASSSPAAKLAAVFSFMKSLDPTSVVRESEQGQVYSAQGAASSLAGKVNALLGEGQLTEAGFQDLVDTANALADSAIDASGSEVNTYLDTYEDTIPDNFKKSLLRRIPKRKLQQKQDKESLFPGEKQKLEEGNSIFRTAPQVSQQSKAEQSVQPKEFTSSGGTKFIVKG